MALTDKLTAIADAIRTKTGKTDDMTLDQMPTEIEGIQSGSSGGNEWEQQCIAAIERDSSNPVTKLPEGLTKIGDYAFYACGNLALTELPSGITSVGNNAFQYCSGLTKITFKGTPRAIAADAFQNCTNLLTINVPWAEGEVANAPWGATNATINYNYTAPSVARVDYLYENYSPNGESFMQTVDIDWAAGDYVEAEIDVTNCTGGTNYEALLSVGLDIGNWGGYNVHMPYKPSTKELQLNYVSSGSGQRKSITVSGNIIRCTITSESVTANDTEYLASEATVNGPGTVEAWKNSSTIQIGSKEGSTRSTATYNFIRIVRG